MPPKYYAFIDGVQKGPFTLDQLMDVGIHPSTYVWSKEMDDWQRADSVEEIRSLFKRHIERKREQALAAPPAAVPLSGNRESSSPDAEAGNAQPASGRRGRFYFPEVEEEPDLDRPPQVSLTLAILSLLLCFPPTGIAAVVFTYKAMKSWQKSNEPMNQAERDDMRRKAHEFERLAKMWMGLTVAFGIIFWTLVFSIPK